MTPTSRPFGQITRGTTNTNRLRRIDRWIGHTTGGVLRSAPDPLVVDLGFGARITTTVELLDRLRRVAPTVQVVGVEIDPERVARARADLGMPPRGLRDRGRLEATPVPGLALACGGFETGALGDRRAVIIRAANVLRQYEEADVPAAWAALRERLTPDGLLVDATCDEVGRVATWMTLSSDGSATLSVSVRLAGLTDLDAVATRLPKALIHRNVPGEPVHEFLTAAQDAWARRAPLGVFGARQRWIGMCHDLCDTGWPVIGGPSRWRLGELTIVWPPP